MLVSKYTRQRVLAESRLRHLTRLARAQSSVTQRLFAEYLQRLFPLLLADHGVAGTIASSKWQDLTGE